MKLGELIDELNWDEVQEALLRNYEDAEKSIVGYEQVFFHLKGMDPVKSDMTIHVVLVDEKEFLPAEIADEPYWTVYGTNGRLNKESEDYENFKDNTSEEWANSEQTFAIEFTPWNKWLGMEVAEETANNIKLMRADIVAYCLWEMTFCGFEEEEIQNKSNEIKEAVNEIKNASPEEREKWKSFKSVDEMLKDFDEYKEKDDENDEDFISNFD